VDGIFLDDGLLTSEGAFHTRRAASRLPRSTGSASRPTRGDGRLRVARAANAGRTGAPRLRRGDARLTLAIAGRTLFGEDMADEAAEIGAA
jgi:hypothetical protein